MSGILNKCLLNLLNFLIRRKATKRMTAIETTVPIIIASLKLVYKETINLRTYCTYEF